MTSKIVAALLSDLEVTKTHLRPRVSNDNLYSGAWFKRLKFVPVSPERFGTLGVPRLFMNRFVEGYNHTHHHAGIGLNTLAGVHHGLAASRAIKRGKVLAEARAQNPGRFSSNAVPKILSLPGPAWINQPAEHAVAETEPKLAA